MVAKVTSGKSIRGVLQYNERKLTAGKAVMLDAVGFGADGGELSISEKHARFQLLTRLNKKVKTNAVHISLNFDRSDLLHPEKLRLIAKRYIEEIGFGDQPFLVYQHLDAAHPHIHIVTTNMQESGKAISLHNIGKEKSEPARKLIEKLFDLTIAESKRKQEPYVLEPLTPERVRYGEVETKSGISNVVRAAARQYKFTDLEGFNAVLRQFGVEANWGQPGSRLYDKKGITYSILDEAGRRTGVPIRASDIYTRPTMSSLQGRFEVNRIARTPYQQRITRIVEATFARKSGPTTPKEFQEALQRYGIYAALKLDNQGAICGITYVDNRTKAVFSERDLPTSCGAASVQVGLNTLATSEAGWNERYVERALAATQNSEDITRLLGTLLAAGTLVRAKETPRGTQYLIGHKDIAPRHYKEAPRQLSNYLRQCGYTESCSHFIANRVRERDTRPVSSHKDHSVEQVFGELAILADTVMHVLLSIIIEALKVHAVKSKVPFHFHQPTKKRRRRL
ncbi:relaxase/mobilization nuclease domain-containing protein [Chitinophaga tropicalis]|uniref:Relaxase/mobilization nuclease domain-containing protein n=1 Tax=Chitinophaga tropicalis TaxID=2683588 RepID=A0A7K1U033_9BACT|nr:relaxase/mobilization nuclease domain-containing protein [Chitinophaga tropicalis]MVT07731.1 relaxase/mobilization nuclease domain-containing protein [Chitinophaga tropicalis]